MKDHDLLNAPNQLAERLQQFNLNPINSQQLAEKLQLDNAHPGILHGGRYWEASFHLMAFLSSLPIKTNETILDVGCGRGLTSVFCAKHFSASVTAIDADPNVYPFLSALERANNCQTQHLNIEYEAINTLLLKNFKYLIASDICFWDEMTVTLIELIERAINAGVNTIAISDPGRPPFLKAAEYCVEKFYAEIIESQLNDSLNEEAYILYIENA